MKTLNSYFLEHNLFDEQSLIDHCERHLVRVHQSPKFPTLRLLHYMESAVYDKKWTEFCKACRGVIVDLENKKIVTYPWDKFYNLTEAPGPSYAECEAMGEFEVSEKMDGSMLLLFQDPTTKLVCATTKGSFDSDQGADATVWARQNLPQSVLDAQLLSKYTLMFEWVAYNNKIVVDYAKKGYKEGMYLLGVRHLQSEKVLSYKEVQDFAKEHNLLTLKTYSFSTLDQVIDTCKNLTWMDEGYVLRFKSTGILTKCKGNDYLRVHRFISQLEDKNLLECMIAGQEKEVLQAAPEEYKDEVISALENYRKQALNVQSKVYRLFAQAPKDNRKNLALWTKLNVPSNLQRYIFHLADQKPLNLTMFYQSFLKVRQPSIGLTNIQVPSLVVLVGCSGSGKSTLGKRLFPKESIVSSDQCRELLCWNGIVPQGLSSVEYWDKMQKSSNGAFQMFHKDIDSLLSKGKLAVADATSLSLRARTALNFIAQKYKVPITYMVNCVPENLCVERDASRKFPVGATVISKQMTQMSQTMEDLSGKGNVLFVTPKNSDQLSVNLVSSTGETILSKEEPVNQENRKKDTVVVDLDGTLADITHRLHYVQNSPPDWKAFFRECTKDTPNDWCVKLIQSLLLSGTNVIVVSARSKEVEAESIAWVRNAVLGKAGTEPLYVGTLDIQLVREAGDSTPDQILKKKWLDNFGKDRILMAVDDRQRVVQMWRDNGVTCLQCNVWEEKPRNKKLPIEPKVVSIK